MMTRRKPDKQYSQDFKLEAVRRMEISGRPATEIAMEPGLA